jgi:hypothetical protein
MNENLAPISWARGGCLCGRITYEITPPFSKFAHCHCRRCRKATGAAHASNIYVLPAQFRWTAGAEWVARYDLPSALSFGKWFCRECGSPVPRATRSGRTYVVPAGSLDDDPGELPKARIFFGSAARWACADDLPRYPEYADGWEASVNTAPRPPALR